MKRIISGFALALASVASAAPSNVPLPESSANNDVFVLEVYDISNTENKLVSSLKIAAPAFGDTASGSVITQSVPYRSECADNGSKVECKSSLGEYGVKVQAKRLDDQQITVKIDHTSLNEIKTFERGSHRIEMPQVQVYSFDRALPLVPNTPPGVWTSDDNAMEYRLYWN